MSPDNCGKKFHVSMLVWQQTKIVLLNSILTCLILELTINYALAEYSNVNASLHAFLDIQLVSVIQCFYSVIQRFQMAADVD